MPHSEGVSARQIRSGSAAFLPGESIRLTAGYRIQIFSRDPLDAAAYFHERLEHCGAGILRVGPVQSAFVANRLQQPAADTENSIAVGLHASSPALQHATAGSLLARRRMTKSPRRKAVGRVGIALSYV